MRKRPGFATIGFVAIIAIIAILAAIVFPVFARVRAKVHQNSSLTNVKQLSLLQLMYCPRYDGKITGGYRVHNGLPMGWQGWMAPCVKNTAIFLCPSDPQTTDSATYLNGHAKWMAQRAAPVFLLPLTTQAAACFWTGMDLPGMQ